MGLCFEQSVFSLIRKSIMFVWNIVCISIISIRFDCSNVGKAGMEAATICLGRLFVYFCLEIMCQVMLVCIVELMMEGFCFKMTS